MKRYGMLAAVLLSITLLGGLSGCGNSDLNLDKIDLEGLTQGGTETPEADQGPGSAEKESAYLGGARITLLSNQSASQMLSCVIETKEGSLLVVDGGTEYDADHLAETIRSKGGRVSAWLVTHPHSDHIGALTHMLADETGSYNDIQIDAIYYSIEPQEWYEEIDPNRAEMVAMFRAAVEAKIDQSRRHEYSPKGTSFSVDEIAVTVLNTPYLIPDFNAINDSSVAYLLEINGKKLIFLGDMGPLAGEQFIAEYSGSLDYLDCDILQMAHHGQYGVNEDVYKILNPEICLWPTPDWLWDNDNGGGYNSGDWYTLETRKWMEDLGVKKNYCIKDGDQVLE